jgi:hypothetical protein
MKSTLFLLGMALSMFSAAQNFIRLYNNFPLSGPLGSVVPMYCIQMTDGRYVMSGASGFLVETDINGVPLSTFSLIDGTTPELSSVNYSCLSQGGDNRIFVGGSKSADTLFFALVDLNDGIIWQKAYDLTGSSLKAMQTSPDGGIIALATSDLELVQSAIPVITKINSDGTLAWQKRYFNALPQYGRMRWESLALTVNGDILLSGVNLDDAGSDTQLVRLDSEGELIWSKTIPSAINFEFGIGLNETSDGNLKCVVASPTSDAYLGTGVLSSSGEWINGKTWSGFSADPLACHIFPDGKTSVVFTNSGDVFYVGGDDNLLFSKTYLIPGDGYLLLSQTFGGNNDNLVFYGGHTESFFGDFSLSLITTGFDGEVLPGFSVPLNVTSEEYSPELNNSIVTDSVGPGLFNLDLNYVTLPLMYDTLMGVNPTIVIDRNESSEILVYPNPTNAFFTISHECLDCEMVLTNMKGELIQRISKHRKEVQVNITNLTPGVYYVNLQKNGKPIATRRLIVSGN